MNEPRLRACVAALDVFAKGSEYEFDDRLGLGRVNWVMTADGWALRPMGTGWQFVAPTQDEAIEQFARKLAEVAGDRVERCRGLYDGSLACRRTIETILGEVRP